MLPPSLVVGFGARGSLPTLRSLLRGGVVMIESISAITLATHDMQRAVRFYISLGFEML